MVGCRNCSSLFHRQDYSGSVDYESGSMHFHDSILPTKPSKPQNYTQRRIDALLQLQLRSSTTSVLDFGSGRGEFVNAAKANGFAVSAFEINRSDFSSLNYSGIELFSTYEDIPKENFDLVTLFHVIEHVSNPREILSQCYSILKGGGKLIIETPNSRDALVSRFKIPQYLDWTYWSHHPMLYSANSLVTVMEKTVFRFHLLDTFRGTVWTII
jgi:SAM-dependent methyltransferase